MKITLRSPYKVKEYHFQPLKGPNGMNLPFVKKVRYDHNGNSEMILSEAERNSPDRDYFIPEDMDIVVTEGTEFDLDNPYERNLWEAIKDSELIAPTRDARDSNGDLIIDGNKYRYGRAELYVDIPGEQSERSVKKRMLIRKAWTYIEEDSIDGRLTKCKLLGKNLRNAPSSDVQEYLYTEAEKHPEKIIDLYTNGDTALRLLCIDAKERNVVKKVGGLYTYGESILGATDDAMILFFKTASNKGLLDQIKKETYPEYIVGLEAPAKRTTKKTTTEE